MSGKGNVRAVEALTFSHRSYFILDKPGLK